MDRANSEFDHLQERLEQSRRDVASAMMEWRALDGEEKFAVRAGAHLRAGRLAGLKADVMTRLGFTTTRW